MKNIIDNIKITAITSYLPTEVLELRTLYDVFGEAEVESVIKVTGIERLRISAKSQTASDMCFEAAEKLIKEEQIDRFEIDGLVFVSQNTDYLLPATSIILQNRLNLSQSTVCIDIHYGCSGYVYGLFQAALWLVSGACKNVLVLAGDTSTKMINPMDKSLKMVFGDCGTATLVTKGTHPMGFSILSDGSGYDRLIIPAGGFRTPCSEETKTLEFDSDNNGRTQEDLYMDGLAIFNFAITRVHRNIDGLIEQMQWNKDDVGLYALHQANNFMVNYVRKKLKVESNKVPTNVTNFGNTGPSTIPLLLTDVCTSVDYSLEKVILSGFGVGLSWGSIACNLSETRFYKPINY